MVGSCWVCHWKKTFWVGGCDGIGGLAYLLFCAAYWSRQPRVFRRLSRSCLSRPYCIKRLHVRVTISSIYQGISVHFHFNPLPEQCLEDVISTLSVRLFTNWTCICISYNYLNTKQCIQIYFVLAEINSLWPGMKKLSPDLFKMLCIASLSSPLPIPSSNQSHTHFTYSSSKVNKPLLEPIYVVIGVIRTQWVTIQYVWICISHMEPLLLKSFYWHRLVTPASGHL